MNNNRNTPQDVQSTKAKSTKDIMRELESKNNASAESSVGEALDREKDRSERGDFNRSFVSDMDADAQREKDLALLFDDSEDEKYSYEKQRNSYKRSNEVRMKMYNRSRTQRTVLIFIIAAVLLTLWLFAAVAIIKHVITSDNNSPAGGGTDTTVGTDAGDDTGNGDPADSTPSDPSDTGSGNPQDTNNPGGIVNPPAGFTYTTVTLADNAYKAGELILINSTYKYDVTADKYLTKELLSAFYSCNGSYSVTYTTEQLRADTITALNEMCAAFQAETGLTGYALRPDYGYCTAEQQQKWFDSTSNKHGADKAPYLEFRGGESEHETGRGFDLRVNVGTGSVPIKDADDVYLWIYDNCYKYGIVYRYPQDKYTLTGVKMEANSTHADHFRYVGKAAAMVMHENNWCLEELLINIENYTYDGEHLKVTGADGVNYEMYYFPAAKDAETQVKVPEGHRYTVSGDNIGGYIVTVTVG